MRQALNNTWVKYGTGFVFGVIILSFVLFFGPQTQGMGPRGTTTVARVGDRQISDVELASAFERYRRLTSQRDRLDEASYADVQRQLALNIAAIELLARRAVDAGLAVSEQDLQCFLVNWHRGYSVDGERICNGYPADFAERFRNYDIVWFTEADGSFTQYYEESVRNRFNMAVNDFERHKERELLARFYLASIAEGVGVPPGQIRDVWQRRNTTVDLEFVRLDPAAAAGAEPTEAEIEAWAAGNASAIQDAYDAEPDRFAEPRQVRIRRIYIRKPADDSPELADARARYEAALARVTTGGEDFEAVARELSEIEREAEAGGDMGLRTSETISSDIWEATEAMTQGEVRGIEQQYAWNIVKLEEVQEARVRPLEEARDEIAAELITAARTAEAAAGLRERGQRVLALAAQAASLAEAAEAEAAERDAATAATMGLAGDGAALLAADGAGSDRLPVATTGPFAAERPSPFLAMGGGLPPGIEFPPEPADSVPSIGASRELMRIAFALSPDAPLHPELIEVDGVSFVVRLSERVDAPSEVPAADAAAIEAEIRNQLVAGLIGDENQQVALALNMPGEPAPIVAAILEEAVSNGAVQLRSNFFDAPDPVEDL